MRLALILSAYLFAVPALADVRSAVTEHILPRHTHLAETSASLATSAAENCSPDGLRPAFNEAYDAWIAVSHIQFGPLEDNGLALAMAFWPDPKDSTGKAIARLTAANDRIVDDPEAFGDVSAAAQGFTALERLLYEPQENAAYACDLTKAISTGLARKSALLADQWPTFGDVMTSAGEAGNTRFQDMLEAQRALYTALSTGLEFLHDQRLGRPLGTFDRPRPRRAEARRSARSLRHILLSLDALEDLAMRLSDAELPKTKRSFANARERALALEDPTLSGVADISTRFRVEVLQQTVRAVQIAVIEEIGAPLGISAGFNRLDGD
ncbi:MAG: imelysin family protein [Pseudomonadota bacterium]